jgi:hypothetical protein
MAYNEFREFAPHHYSRWIFDDHGVPPWLKKLSQQKRDVLHHFFAKALALAVEGYLDHVVEQLPLKRAVKGKITPEDIKVQIAQIRRELSRMKEYVYGTKPLAFTRSNPYYRKGDEKAPFYSEAFLYALLGKDAGRTVGYAFERLCKLAGVDQG